MSNIKLIIEERAARIGDFLVGRLLPFRQKRAVGPFVFIDHMGPVDFSAGQNLDIAPHPHIGLSTLTYLFEGNIMHRDSLGNELEISPGAVNWMTAGKGVVHSERTPDRLRNTPKRLHGLQIWVALPKALEQTEPNFYHAEKDKLPSWEADEVMYKLIAGEALGKKSPVPVYSELYMLEIVNLSQEDKQITIGEGLYGESGLYILEGSVRIKSHRYTAKQLLVTQESHLCSFELSAKAKVYVFGGEALPEKRFIHWNFVASDMKNIEKARTDWEQQNFPKVPNETEYIPLPTFNY